MSQKQHVTIPTTLVPEIEAWGEMTAKLFGKLRRQAGLKPANIPDGQSWYWTDEWQQREREADEDIKAGRVKDFDNAEDLIKDLHAHV